ncbi:MAG: type I-F CRISPR-associated helicase Cas3 [Gammaproteobacteria bacterium]|nr:type I-F CRISPR-associated helicase Cas3 [Gammaproteobacteria bacterium]
MMVTFVSQCEKKALNRTRRVLDSFANRIGDNAWQTVITNEGLNAAKKLLRKTASKNTAVSCHWIRSRSRSEMVWIVGNRAQFNEEGFVPVNRTQKSIINSKWGNDWHYLPLIKSLAALAALFHDWGKASEFFQTKLKQSKFIGDPLRHEWISTLFLNVYVNGETDEQWLTRLANGEITANDLKALVCEKHEKQQNKNKPLKKLSNAASLLAWLVVSHHRLPAIKENQGETVNKFEEIFALISQKWGYENNYDEKEFKKNLTRCFDYPKGLPSESEKWLRYTKRNAKELLDCLPLLEQSIADGSWRLILHHVRLSLMLGDHNYSSQDKNLQWNSSLDLYANTDRESELKQKLDEHLVGVAKQAVRIAHLLPAFEGKNDELQHAYDVKPLKQESPAKFRWQDTAVTKINIWREQQSKRFDSSNFGFFAVNMASTGKGKTFANAKIMRSLSVDGKSLRYILALGLRTLTLQTGDEYRERIKLEKDELAVLIGSHAVMDLHNRSKQENTEEAQRDAGSESEETLLDNEIYFESDIPESDLTTVLKKTKDRQFLFAPVLSCTIDHLMAATETKRGGRYILPSLRLMSSDLVIDEIDDFDGKDLIAIGRLIHLAGMLGRKVMISSATIPPDLAEGYYNAYQAGWAIFARMRERSPVIGCAWIDESTTHVHNINCAADDQGITDYQQRHQYFITNRLKELKKQPAKRKANIIPCDIAENNSEEKETIHAFFYSVIQLAILEKHQQNFVVDQESGKSVSFGVVRVANITPCVEFTRYLLNTQWPENVEIRTMAYHSQQVLIMRNEQEKHLDAVLKRGKGEQAAFSQSVIKAHLKNITAPHVIFILVATPVEEVGRDHDFDWAVAEPSSYRSFIQLAGRVMRHREPEEAIQHPNVALLQRNLKALINDGKPAFCFPGYESNDNQLETHDLNELVDTKALSEKLDAQPRISKRSTPKPQYNLADLEHECIHQLLTNYEKQGPESMQGWLTGCWWLTAVPQLYVKFRASSPQLIMYLALFDSEWKFAEKNQQGRPIDKEKVYGITREELSEQECQRLWLYRDYEELLKKSGKPSLGKAALVYGEVGLPINGKDLNDLRFVYSSQLGLIKKK